MTTITQEQSVRHKITNPNGFHYVSQIRLNDTPYPNRYLSNINQSLEIGDKVLVFFESKDSRKKRILNKYPSFISIPYYLLDFILKRVFPKLKLTYGITQWLTKGRNKVISLPECLGRLHAMGFTIVDQYDQGYHTYIEAKKSSEPLADPNKETYGVYIRLNRIGKNGKIIKVLKLRTMHPFSEFIQGYVFDKNALAKGGKLKDDFRITSWGKILRKFWIDELPMMSNLFKGEMKLVGIRPLSPHFFSLYPADVQMLRVQVTPGLIPPFYADMPNTLEEIVESERRYIQASLKSPFKTDFIYFCKAMRNILFRKARSK